MVRKSQAKFIVRNKIIQEKSNLCGSKTQTDSIIKRLPQSAEFKQASLYFRHPNWTLFQDKFVCRRFVSIDDARYILLPLACLGTGILAHHCLSHIVPATCPSGDVTFTSALMPLLLVDATWAGCIFPPTSHPTCAAEDSVRPKNLSKFYFVSAFVTSGSALPISGYVGVMIKLGTSI